MECTASKRRGNLLQSVQLLLLINYRPEIRGQDSSALFTLTQPRGFTLRPRNYRNGAFSPRLRDTASFLSLERRTPHRGGVSSVYVLIEYSVTFMPFQCCARLFSPGSGYLPGIFQCGAQRGTEGTRHFVHMKRRKCTLSCAIKELISGTF